MEQNQNIVSKKSITTNVAITVLSILLVVNLLTLMVFAAGWGATNYFAWTIYHLFVLTILAIIGFFRLKKWVIIPTILILLTDVYNLFFITAGNTTFMMSKIFNWMSCLALAVVVLILVYLWSIRQKFN